MLEQEPRETYYNSIDLIQLGVVHVNVLMSALSLLAD